MKNMYITWNKENELGIPIIDEQHRGAVATINSLFYFMQDERGLDALRPTLNVLDQYTIIHFETEEALLKQKGYPDLEAHVLLHKELIEKMGHVMREAIAQSDPKVVLTFLKQWWMDHINEEDRKYSSYMASKS